MKRLRNLLRRVQRIRETPPPPRVEFWLPRNGRDIERPRTNRIGSATIHLYDTADGRCDVEGCERDHRATEVRQ